MSLVVLNGFKLVNKSLFLEEVAAMKKDVMKEDIYFENLNLACAMALKYLEKTSFDDMDEDVSTFLYSIKLEEVLFEAFHESRILSEIRLGLQDKSWTYDKNANNARISMYENDLLYFKGGYKSLEKFREFKSIVPYHAWDNSDQDDSVSEEDWNIRIEEWYANINKGYEVDIVVFEEELKIDKYELCIYAMKNKGLISNKLGVKEEQLEGLFEFINNQKERAI